MYKLKPLLGHLNAKFKSVNTPERDVLAQGGTWNDPVFYLLTSSALLLLLFVGWDWVPRYLLKSLGI
jgi:hypothetical protein